MIVLYHFPLLTFLFQLDISFFFRSSKPTSPHVFFGGPFFYTIQIIFLTVLSMGLGDRSLDLTTMTIACQFRRSAATGWFLLYIIFHSLFS